jgi:hypothetical protein
MSKIIGAHSIIYSSNVIADRKFFKDVLKLSSVDVGGGWLIFSLPPSEIAFHPIYDEKSSKHGDVEFYLMVDDIKSFTAEMKKKKIRCGKINDYGWGLMSELTTPGGSKLMMYEPRHERPADKPKKKAKKK